MPSGPACHSGNQLPVFASADHQSWMVFSIGLEVTDGGKKLLVPGANQHRFSRLEQGLPFFFVNQFKPERKRVKPDQIIGKTDKRPGVDNELKLFQCERFPLIQKLPGPCQSEQPLDPHSSKKI